MGDSLAAFAFISKFSKLTLSVWFMGDSLAAGAIIGMFSKLTLS